MLENALCQYYKPLISYNQHIIQLSSRGLQLATTFLLFIFTSQLLGPEGRGEISIFIANQTILQLCSEIIFGSAYIYLVQQYNRNSIVRKGILWSVFTSICMTYSLYILDFCTSQTMFWLIGNSFLFSLYTCLLLDLRIQHKGTSYALFSIAYPLLHLITFIVLNTFYSAQIELFFISQSISCVLCIWLIKLSNPVLPKSTETNIDWKTLLQKGLAASGSNWINFFSTRSSYYLLFSALGNSAIIGFYSSSVLVSELVWVIPYALAIPLIPLISQQPQVEKHLVPFLDTVRINWLLSLICTLILYSIPGSFYSFLLGSKFDGIQIYLYLLLPGTLILSQGKIYWNYFQGIGNFKINTMGATLGLITTIVGILISLYYNKLLYVALSTSLGYIVYAFYLFYHFQKIHPHLRWYFLIPFQKFKP
ncbi:MAG: hypothetical protein MUE33_02850 [Cytophagaceae bacterium]|nr:hypothetical protein [Cytophagaceae bacterium]